MMLFWIVLIVVVVYLLLKSLDKDRNRSQSNHETPQINSALKILDERYSKGEIDDEEYLRKKKNLI